jgi:hypothetical protein
MTSAYHRKALRLAILLLGCGCAADDTTTLAELATYDDLRLQSSFERDACSCSCGNYVCWNFSCTGEGCSSADEYELAVDRAGECHEGTPGLMAKLVIAGSDAIEPSRIGDTCGDLTLTWRGLPHGIDLAQPHEVEIADGSATWLIQNPFAPPMPVLLAPESAISGSSSEPPTLNTDTTMIIGWDAEVRVTVVHGTLRATSHQRPSIDLQVVDIQADRMELRVPPETAAGLYEVALTAQTELEPSACQGPPACRGLDLAMSFELRIE